MVHVTDVEAGLAWYRRAFTNARLESVGEPAFKRLNVGEIHIEVVPADDKVPSGPAGSVVYWYVAHFEPALLHFQSVGATLYRGPMSIENEERMCQLRDPWGNCIGLRGPSFPEGT